MGLEDGPAAHHCILPPFLPGPKLAFQRAKSLLGWSGSCHLCFHPQPSTGLLEFVFPVAASFDFWEERNTIDCGFPVWGYLVVGAVVGAPKWVSKFEAVDPVHSSGNSLGRKLKWFDRFSAEKHLRLLHAPSYQTRSAIRELSYCCFSCK